MCGAHMNASEATALDHRTSHKSLGYICGNSQIYCTLCQNYRQKSL